MLLYVAQAQVQWSLDDADCPIQLANPLLNI